QRFNKGIKGKKMSIFNIGITTCKTMNNCQKRDDLPHQFRLTQKVSLSELVEKVSTSSPIIPLIEKIREFMKDKEK
ncbi:MAG: hypothetical protein U9Q89_08410, partial [Thermodesulfobacteriota bacterium]|nr:hypothetical protein [Thermodesulfobacteriota bacterium]